MGWQGRYTHKFANRNFIKYYSTMTKKFTSGAILYAPPTLEVSCFESECSAVLSNFGNTESYNIYQGDNADGTQSWQ